jgi:hypothetical protein
VITLINIDPALKTIYKNDRFPMSTVAHPKDMEANFTSLGLLVAGDQFADDKGEFELSEGICRDNDLKFGKCNAAQVKFTVADVVDEIAGKEFFLKQTVDNLYDMPFGYFTVETCPKQDDLRFKDITAYDRMRKAFIDVASWYNGLTFPMTLAAFRASFLAFVGLAEDTSRLPLPNDSMTIEKTVEAAQLLGQQVIEAIEEINGVFGVINSEGKFSHAILKPVYGLYPSSTLYPSDALYPVAETDTSYTQPDLLDDTVTVAMREGIRFEEYTVPEIDKLIIRGEEDDIGAIVGTGSNAYIIEGNFLVFGKSAAELEVIARNAYGYMAKRPYRPFECSQIGLPYVKPGDMLKFEQDDPVVGYMLNRTLKGVQAIRDEYTSPGSQKRTQNTGQNTEIIKLKYKTTKIKKDVEGVRIDVEDLAEQTSTQFEQTASVISLKANAADVNSAFVQTANSIALKVDKSGVITSINLSPEAATITANKINFNGYATFDVNGNLTTIDGSVLKTGTVVADTVRAGWIYAGNISASQITGGTISGVTFVTVGTYGTVTITNGGVTADYATIRSLDVPTQLNVGFSIQMMAYDGSITAAHLTCYDVNGGVPVTSDNISGQAVGYANSAGSVSSLQYHTTDEITASNTGYGNIDFSGFDNACGVNYAQATFQPIGASDVRLKHSILPMDNIPDELFYSLKPYQFKYKTDTYGDGLFFGLIAQQLENAFLSYGLNPYEYDLIEVKDVKKYTDDGFYVDDKTHRIHYNNFIAWLIKIVQKQNERIVHLENIIK